MLPAKSPIMVMPDDWNQAVTGEYTGGEARFDFPVRPLGWARLMGVFLIAFSVAFDWVPAHLFWQNFARSAAGPSGGIDLLFNLIFPASFLLAGLFPMVVGLLILFGRCRVEWRGGQLRSAERLGPFFWTRRLPKKPIARFLAAASLAQHRDTSLTPKTITRFAALVVMYTDGSKQWLVLGYPQAWILGVAQKLQGYVGGVAGSSTPVPVHIVADMAATISDVDVLNPPLNSRAQVTGSGNSLRIFLPPPGFWRGAKGLVWFALAWCAFVSLLTIASVHSLLTQDSQGLSPLPLLLMFWPIGLILLAVVIQLGRRKVELVVESHQLCVTIKGPFRTTQKRWAQPEVAAIRVDRSNVEVNHRILPELQIHPRGGKKWGLLAGHDEPELLWLATRLRQALQVPARTG